MKTLVAVLLLGAFTFAHAELPPPTAEEKKAAAVKAEKAAAEKAKAAKDLAKAQDRAAANYRKNKGTSSAGPTTVQPEPPQSRSGAPGASPSQGADHSKAKAPDSELTRQEAQTEMPKPGQANDHSTTARDPQNSSPSR